MKGWSTLFTILGILILLLSLFALSFGVAVFLGVFVSSLSCFFFASLCGRITDILENQQKILDNQREALEAQNMLRVMISNLDK